MRTLPGLGSDIDDAPQNAPVAFPKRWVDEHEAIRITGRSSRSLRRWRLDGLIRRRKRRDVHVFEVGDLLAAVADTERRITQRGFKPGQPGGPGRPQHPARPRVAELLAQGVSVAQAARECGCSFGVAKNVKQGMTADEN